jgi:hypothetical protein
MNVGYALRLRCSDSGDCILCVRFLVCKCDVQYRRIFLIFFLCSLFEDSVGWFVQGASIENSRMYLGICYSLDMLLVGI